MAESVIAYLLGLGTGFVEYWVQGWMDVQALTWAQFVRTFWWLLVFDLPRYILPDIVLLIYLTVQGLFHWPKKMEIDYDFLPTVSVLVPAHNERESAAKTVRSLLEQDYPISEIIVVDDGSMDGTYESVLRFSTDPRVKVIRNDVRGGKASALQTALSMSSGEILVSCDSDSTFDRDAVRWLVQYFKDPRVGAVSGNIKVRNRNATLATWMQAAEYEIAISVGRRVNASMDFLTVVSGAFGAYRREDIVATGGWDPGIGDDSNATLKVRKRKKRIAFAWQAICLTDAPERWRILWRQRRRWDKSGYRNRVRKHPGLLNPFIYSWSSTIAILLALFYRIVLLFLFLFWFFYDLLWLHRGNLAWIIMVTFAVYAVANFISLVVAWMTSPRGDEWKLFWTAPFLMFHHWFLRGPRALSTFEEIFGLNYRQRFYPDHVWEQAPKW